MTRQYSFTSANLLLSSLFFSACGADSTAPPGATTGSLEFNVATTGTDIDTDGFVLTVDGGLPQAVSTNGTLSLTTTGGSHTVAISGFAFNCDVAAPTSASVVAGSTTRVDIRATCTPFLRGAIIFTSDQMGSMAPDVSS